MHRNVRELTGLLLIVHVKLAAGLELRDVQFARTLEPM